MTTETEVAEYQIDLTDTLAVFHFPRDFADWLRDRGRESEARQFLIRFHEYEKYTPDEELSLGAVVGIAQDYAVIVNVSGTEETPFATAEEIILMAEDDPTIKQATADWSLEDDLIIRDAPSPRDLAVPEFEDVAVVVLPGDPPLATAMAVLVALHACDYPVGRRQLKQDLTALLRRTRRVADLYELLMSYVRLVTPEEADQIIEEQE